MPKFFSSLPAADESGKKKGGGQEKVKKAKAKYATRSSLTRSTSRYLCDSPLRTCRHLDGPLMELRPLRAYLAPFVSPAAYACPARSDRLFCAAHNTRIFSAHFCTSHCTRLIFVRVHITNVLDLLAHRGRHAALRRVSRMLGSLGTLPARCTHSTHALRLSYRRTTHACASPAICLRTYATHRQRLQHPPIPPPATRYRSLSAADFLHSRIFYLTTHSAALGSGLCTATSPTTSRTRIYASACRMPSPSVLPDLRFVYLPHFYAGSPAHALLPPPCLASTARLNLPLLSTLLPTSPLCRACRTHFGCPLTAFSRTASFATATCTFLAHSRGSPHRISGPSRLLPRCLCCIPGKDERAWKDERKTLAFCAPPRSRLALFAPRQISRN